MIDTISNINFSRWESPVDALSRKKCALDVFTYPSYNNLRTILILPATNQGIVNKFLNLKLLFEINCFVCMHILALILRNITPYWFPNKPPTILLDFYNPGK